MESIATLGSILGLGFLSGLRLYSTVLAVGLGIRFGFFEPPPSLEDLRVLASTPILLIAGFVYVVEFVADKVPWIDSAWDAIHTFIRPLGAAIIAGTALGEVNPTVKVAVVLLCGFVALSSHSAKAGTRLAANHSPEPFSNIGLSLFEDGVVLGGAWLVLQHPIVALVLVVLLVALIVWLVPKLFRLFRRSAGRVARVFRGGAGRAETGLTGLRD